MVKNISKKFIAILAILILIAGVFSPISKVYADFMIASADLHDNGEVGRNLLHKADDGTFKAVITHYVTYTYNGNEYPAYCLNKDLPGVGETSDYTVNVSSAVTNQKVYRVIINGFPYKSASELGVETDGDAFQATKQAVYCVLDGTDPRTNFKGANARGDKIVNAIINLTDIGNNGSQTYSEARVDITKEGDLTKEKLNNKNYYVQTFKVTSPQEMGGTYDAVIAGLPVGTKVMNENNEEQKNFSGETIIKVAIPEDEITGTINGKLVLQNVKCKTYPILYGNTTVAGTQDYALAGDPYELYNSNADLTLKINAPTLIKTERGTTTGVKGAEYTIFRDTNENQKYDAEDTPVKTVTTGENGKVTLTDLTAGMYIAKETKAPEGYNLDSVDQAFEVTPNTTAVTVKSDDSPITAPVTIMKQSNDKSEITGKEGGTPLAGAEFNIYDKNHVLLKKVTTDENGQIQDTMRYGTYYVQEVKAPEWYLLDDKEQVISIQKQGEPVTLTFGDNAVQLGTTIEKEGIVQAQPNDEIRYDFPVVRNDSNVSVDNFTWSDELPTDYIRITKLYTGTWNETLNYKVLYKLNNSEIWQEYKNPDSEDGTYTTDENHFIDFTTVQTEDSYITDFKLEFGTVKPGFEAVEKPFIFAKVLPTVKANDTWTNYTKIESTYTSNHDNTVELKAHDDWTTTSYSAKLSIKKLPKTGV